MDLIEVLERCRQLPHHSRGIAQVHTADVIATKRIDEALRAAYRCVDGFESKGSGHLAHLDGNVSAAVVTHKL